MESPELLISTHTNSGYHAGSLSRPWIQARLLSTLTKSFHFTEQLLQY